MCECVSVCVWVSGWMVGRWGYDAVGGRARQQGFLGRSGEGPQVMQAQREERAVQSRPSS